MQSGKHLYNINFCGKGFSRKKWNLFFFRFVIQIFWSDRSSQASKRPRGKIVIQVIVSTLEEHWTSQLTNISFAKKSFCRIFYHCHILLEDDQVGVRAWKWIFFSIWVFFHKHLRITGLQGKGKGEGISLTPQYYFHLLYRHLDISRAIAARSLSLHIASSRARIRNLWFRSASR